MTHSAFRGGAFLLALAAAALAMTATATTAAPRRARDVRLHGHMLFGSAIAC
ncbi:MAG: hypothetical protein LC789_08150 [Actinobacteria bacterium]|nr:hypothetical protein [Actinomycetota bacterium]MCA1720071.1 hypothetical protein [Actinomycetota bacterium]